MHPTIGTVRAAREPSFRRHPSRCYIYRMNNVTGIILAGGKSSRLGYPKYRATLDGKSLLEIAISKLEPFCEEIIVASKEPISRRFFASAQNDTSFCHPEEPQRGDARISGHIVNIIEQSQEFHPLIGITEGLKASKNDANIILACDTPFISTKLLNDLTNSTAEICLYRYKGRAEPLLGLYRKSCLKKIDHQPSATSHQPRIIDILSKCNLEYIDVENESLDFFNINTKEDLIEAEKRVRSNPKLLGN